MTKDDQIPRRLARETVFDSDYLKLHLDQVRQPNGHVIEDFHFVEYPCPAVGAIVEDGLGRVVMVRVPRYTLQSCSWSIPAGGVEKGEEVLFAAKREVREETGYDSSDHRLIYSYFPQAGSSNKRFVLVWCKAGEKTDDFDPNEISEVGWFTPRQVEMMIERGEIEDGLGLTALLLWLRTTTQN